MGISKKEALQAIEREREMICAASDAVWDHPETAFQEFKSTEILCELLEKEGFSVERNLAGIQTAFSGRFGHGKPVVGILGEFDALSGLSQESESIEKVPVCEGEPGHGCGHNLLGAGSVAAAIAVKEYLEKNGKEGTVVFFGCPGEEGGSGKGFMARDGVFDELDFAISWHPGDQNEVSVGSSLANYQVFYRFFGTASHAAACPELGRSALDAVELMNTGVQYLREHAIQEARIHYAITNTGGYSPNVVQPFAEVLYLIRAPKNDQVKELFERVNDIARGAALITGTTVDIKQVAAYSDLINNETLNDLIQENLERVIPIGYTEEELDYARKFQSVITELDKEGLKAIAADIGGRDRKKELLETPLWDFIVDRNSRYGGGGSTDVGDVSWKVPTAHVYVNCYAAGTALHSWQATAQGKSSIAHKGMIAAAKVMANIGAELLLKPELVEKAKEDWKEELNGEEYPNPLPKDLKPEIW